MALHLLASVHHCNLTGLLPFKRPNAPVISRNGNVPRPNSKCMATNEISVSNGGSTVRRSANYQPSIWHYNYIQSLTSEYVGESCTRQLDELKGEVRMMFHKVVEPGEQLELIDILQRLGLSYHFEDEIRSTLEGVYMNTNHGICNKERNLYTTALGFRLLRQNGFSVPQDIFNSFTNDKGNLEESLGEDTKGMLSLYEASFLLREGESMLEEAGDFATRKLKEYLKQNISEDQNLSSLVRHALELPLHWRMIRLEVRWFIDIYRSREDMNPILLELAELDFNMVQAVHQEDLKQLSRWWRRTGLGEKLSFARDRLMENFLWTVGKAFEPQFGYCRRTLTKVNALITVIDDVYDVYGTLHELQLFTDAIERWDTNAMDRLPYYMKICFLALHNSINEMAFDILKEQGFHIIPYFRKAWADQCRSFLLEAKWYYSGYTPSLEEYIENGWVSIGPAVMLVHIYFSITNPITKETLDWLEEVPNISRWSSMVVRFADDLGTSKVCNQRLNFALNILKLVLNEIGASEEDAREYIRSLISATWKKMNGEKFVSHHPFSQTFIEIAMNIARMSQCMYQHGDGHSVQDGETKDRVLSLLIHPIPLYKDKWD
ncbi:myrcene synthase, chloroplastic-like [Corylus avellana]|uniref:myrcene synthase, chloroplastic-like n=1 Tax=Corylus avellana TaxID=13451 RepID=UPI00286A5F26|nr:myrcene synthase, chloroplastic-like [Corylus avellana]